MNRAQTICCIITSLLALPDDIEASLNMRIQSKDPMSNGHFSLRLLFRLLTQQGHMETLMHIAQAAWTLADIAARTKSPSKQSKQPIRSLDS